MIRFDKIFKKHCGIGGFRLRIKNILTTVGNINKKVYFSKVFVLSFGQNTFDYSSGNNTCYCYIKFEF